MEDNSEGEISKTSFDVRSCDAKKRGFSKWCVKLEIKNNSLAELKKRVYDGMILLVDDLRRSGIRIALFNEIGPIYDFSGSTFRTENFVISFKFVYKIFSCTLFKNLIYTFTGTTMVLIPNDTNVK